MGPRAALHYIWNGSQLSELFHRPSFKEWLKVNSWAFPLLMPLRLERRATEGASVSAVCQVWFDSDGKFWVKGWDVWEHTNAWETKETFEA